MNLGVSPESIDEPDQFFHGPGGLDDQTHGPLVIIVTAVGGVWDQVIDESGGQSVARMAI